MKIYLAHNFKARWWLRDYIKLLESMGHTVTSSWIVDDSHCQPEESAVFKQDDALSETSAVADLNDIDVADALILFTDQYGERPGKGKWMEFGYALAKGKKIFIHGQDTRSSVFYHLPQVRILKLISDINDIDTLNLTDSLEMKLD